MQVFCQTLDCRSIHWRVWFLWSVLGTSLDSSVVLNSLRKSPTMQHMNKANMFPVCLLLSRRIYDNTLFTLEHKIGWGQSMQRFRSANVSGSIGLPPICSQHRPCRFSQCRLHPWHSMVCWGYSWSRKICAFRVRECQGLQTTLVRGPIEALTPDMPEAQWLNLVTGTDILRWRKNLTVLPN